MSINITSSGTPTPFPPGGGGGGHQNQLAAGHYENFVAWPSVSYTSQTEADTFPFVIYPRPDSETNINARHRWAHDQMIYEVPIYLRGGAFDYWAEIETTNTSEALLPYITVTNNWRNTTGDKSCYVQITALGIQTLAKDGTAYDVYLKVYDQLGRELKVWWSFKPEVNENDHFIIYDNSSTTGTYTGTWTNPYRDLLDTDSGANYLTGTGVNTFEKIVVIKEGNSQTTPYTKSDNWIFEPTGFPIAIINNPADTNRPVIDLQATNVLFVLSGSSSAGSDHFIWGLEVLNGMQPAQIDGYGAFNRAFGSGTDDRFLLANCKFDTVANWPTTTGTNNCALVFESTTSQREHMVVSDIEITNLAPSNLATNVGNALMMMGTRYSCFDNWVISNFAQGATTVGKIAQFKKSLTESVVRRWTAIDNVTCTRYDISEDTGVTGYEHQNVEICYINIRSQTTQDIASLIFITADIGIGPVYGYRNTITTPNGATRGRIDTNYVMPLTLKGSVHSGILNDNGTATTVISDYASVSLTYFQTDNKLTDLWFTDEGLNPTADRGTVGHEIA